MNVRTIHRAPDGPATPITLLNSRKELWFTMSITTLASAGTADKPPTRVTEVEIQSARQELSRLVVRQAVQVTDQLGFGWEAVPSAPSTYQQLRGALDWTTRSPPSRRCRSRPRTAPP